MGFLLIKTTQNGGASDFAETQKHVCLFVKRMSSSQPPLAPGTIRFSSCEGGRYVHRARVRQLSPACSAEPLAQSHGLDMILASDFDRSSMERVQLMRMDPCLV